MAGAGLSRLVPTRLAAWMQPFQQGFTAPTWQHVLVLILGAILTPGRRTVAAALRVTGLAQDPHFTNYHRVLNRNHWSSRWIARCLLRLLIDTLVPTGPVVIGLDDPGTALAPDHARHLPRSYALQTATSSASGLDGCRQRAADPWAVASGSAVSVLAPSSAMRNPGSDWKLTLGRQMRCKPPLVARSPYRRSNRQ